MQNNHHFTVDFDLNIFQQKKFNNRLLTSLAFSICTMCPAESKISISTEDPPEAEKFLACATGMMLSCSPQRTSVGFPEAITLSLRMVCEAEISIAEEQDLLDSINQAINDTMDQFRNRQSKIGRARIFGEKSIGLDDPGMLAFKRMFESLQT